MFIDQEQPEHRRLWTDAHEATHAMSGWHAQVLRVDNEDTLFKELRAGVEAEANFGAGYLIFQGGRFHREALRAVAQQAPRPQARARFARQNAPPRRKTPSKRTPKKTCATP